MHISLRAGEKIYINGAVLRVDRKVSIELLNDASFLLEAHVMRAEDATTPLRQLYFIVQVLLMNPTDSEAVRDMFDASVDRTISAFDDVKVVAGLRSAADLVAASRTFEALKTIRSLFPIESRIFSEVAAPPPEKLNPIRAA